MVWVVWAVWAVWAVGTKGSPFCVFLPGLLVPLPARRENPPSRRHRPGCVGNGRASRNRGKRGEEEAREAGSSDRHGAAADATCVRFRAGRHGLSLVCFRRFQVLEGSLRECGGGGGGKRNRAGDEAARAAHCPRARAYPQCNTGWLWARCLIALRFSAALLAPPPRGIDVTGDAVRPYARSRGTARSHRTMAGHGVCEEDDEVSIR